MSKTIQQYFYLKNILFLYKVIFSSVSVHKQQKPRNLAVLGSLCLEYNVILR